MTVREAWQQLIRTIEAAQKYNIALRDEAYNYDDKDSCIRLVQADFLFFHLMEQARDIETTISRLERRDNEAVSLNHQPKS